MEYVTVRGRKMKKIPVEELQFLQLYAEGLMGCLNQKVAAKVFHEKIDSVSKKYDMPFEDVDFQYSFRRRKDVLKVLNMPHKKFLAFDEEISGSEMTASILHFSRMKSLSFLSLIRFIIPSGTTTKAFSPALMHERSIP